MWKKNYYRYTKNVITMYFRKINYSNTNKCERNQFGLERKTHRKRENTKILSIHLYFKHSNNVMYFQIPI